MKRFKFRAWDKVSKTMIDLLDLTQFMFDTRIGVFVPFAGTHDVVQFTGILDCNGKEVYEGDIIKGKAELHNKYVNDFADVENEVVRWNEDYMAFTISKNIHYPSHLYPCFLHQMESFNIEVVGNIYENPELLI